MPTSKPKPRDFDCPDCPAKAGRPCRSARGKSLPTCHTRRIYKAQDAFLEQKPRTAGAAMKALTPEMIRALQTAEQSPGLIVSAGSTVNRVGRVEQIFASTITSLIRRGLLERSYGSEGGVGGRLTGEGRAALADPTAATNVPLSSPAASGEFIDVWMNNLARSASGLNFHDADDRATFRGNVYMSMRGLKWSGMRDIAKHLGAKDVTHSRDAALRAIADLYMRQRGWQKTAPAHATKRATSQNVDQALLDSLERSPGTTEAGIRSYLRGEYGDSAALERAFTTGRVVRRGQKLYRIEDAP